MSLLRHPAATATTTTMGTTVEGNRRLYSNASSNKNNHARVVSAPPAAAFSSLAFAQPPRRHNARPLEKDCPPPPQETTTATSTTAVAVMNQNPILFGITKDSIPWINDDDWNPAICIPHCPTNNDSDNDSWSSDTDNEADSDTNDVDMERRQRRRQETKSSRSRRRSRSRTLSDENPTNDTPMIPTTSPRTSNEKDEDLSHAWNMEELGHYERACLASFMALFSNKHHHHDHQVTGLELPQPTVDVVVEGLWTSIMLPPLVAYQPFEQGQCVDNTTTLESATTTTRTARQVAQQVLHNLTVTIPYLTMDSQHNLVISNDKYQEYAAKNILEEFSVDVVQDWKRQFQQWLFQLYKSPATTPRGTFVAPNDSNSDDDDDKNQQEQLLKGSHCSLRDYAAQALLPLCLQLKDLDSAKSFLNSVCHHHHVDGDDNGSRLLQSTSDSTETMLQRTRRYIDMVEEYLACFIEASSPLSNPDTLVSKSPLRQAMAKEEALELYEAWHSRLQDDMNQIMCHETTATTTPSTCVSDMESNKDKIKDGPMGLNLPNQPKHICLLGRSFHTLVQSLNTFLVTTTPGSSVDGIEKLWQRQAEYLVQAIKLYSHVILFEQDNKKDQHQLQEDHYTGIILKQVATCLCVDSWLELSYCITTMEENDMAFDEVVNMTELSLLFGPSFHRGSKPRILGTLSIKHPAILCLNIALALLETPTTLNCAPLRLYRETLCGHVNDAMGRHLYDQGLYGSSRGPLDEATRKKRAVLAMLERRGRVDYGSVAPLTPKAVSSPHQGFFAMFSKTPAKAIGDDDDEDARMYVVIADEITSALEIPNLDSSETRNNREAELEKASLSLAQTLEYTALAMHAEGVSMPALSLLQESLMFQTTYSGEMHLEVARLMAAMAVVHDDLLQWEEGLKQCHACLRIRLHFLSQWAVADWFPQHEELFNSALENLRAMGNSYRILDDHDNAIGCYWKIAAMSRKRWEVQRDRDLHTTNFCGFTFEEHQRQLGDELRSLPLPTLFLDELRYKIPNNLEKCFHPSPDNGGESVRMFFGETLQSSNNDEIAASENNILREVAQAFQTILSLFKDKAFASKQKKRTDLTGTNLADVVSVDFVPLLLSTSYQLGLIHMHFRDYRSAACSFEQSIKCLWILDPNNSESGSEASSDEEDGSTRYADRKRIQTRNRNNKRVFDKYTDDVDEECVYRALGLCHAGCGDNDQAIRFHLTALRYARKTHGVNSTNASIILYDIGMTYWYMCEYEKAHEFWRACAQIQLKHRTGDEQDSTEEFDGDDGTTMVANLAYAKTLYNIGASLCAIGRFRDSMTVSCLEEAKEIFAHQVDGSFSLEEANCLFYIALVKYQCSERDLDALLQAKSCIQQASHIYHSHGYLDWTGYPADMNSPRSCKTLDAHIQYLQGSIFKQMGNVRQALKSKLSACRLYKSQGAPWGLYAASALHSIGKLYSRKNEDDKALECFEEALRLRRGQLGPDNEAVGMTLSHMGDIYSRRHQYVTGMELYKESIRIFSATDGDSSSRVADVLLKMSALEASEGLYTSALRYLKDSHCIRIHRVGMAFNASVATTRSATMSMSRSCNKRVAEGDLLRKKFKEDLAREELDLAIVLHCMGNVHGKLQQFAAAVECYEGSLQARRRSASANGMVTSDIPIMMADTLHNLGFAYELCMKFDKALDCLSESLKLKCSSDISVDEEPVTKITADDQIVLYNGNAGDDGSYLRHAGSLSYAATLHRLGVVHSRTKNYHAAVTCFESALSIQKCRLADNNLKIAQTLSDLGKALHGIEHRRCDALRCYREAFQIRQRRASGDDVVLLYRMGSVYELDSDYSHAIYCYRLALRMYGRQYVKSIGQDVCNAIRLRRRRTLRGSNEGQYDSGDSLFAMSEIQSKMSIEEQDKCNQEYFRKVLTALNTTSQRKVSTDNSVLLDLDVNASDCWVSLELYILNLIELMSLLSREWTDSIRLPVLRDLQQRDGDGVMPAQEFIVFQMLYLIQN